jgi:hypothetical protein
MSDPHGSLEFKPGPSFCASLSATGQGAPDYKLGRAVSFELAYDEEPLPLGVRTGGLLDAQNRVLVTSSRGRMSARLPGSVEVQTGDKNRGAPLLYQPSAR